MRLSPPARVSPRSPLSAYQGRRPDGYHDVRTILQGIDLVDRLKIAARRGPLEIRCNVPGVPLDRTNLVWKAAQLLWLRAGWDGEPRDTLVTLQKNIPMQAGLGGGSSNAAAALVGLARVWKLRVPDARILRWPPDWSYFARISLLRHCPCLGCSKRFIRRRPPCLGFVLVFPPFGFPTRTVWLA